MDTIDKIRELFKKHGILNSTHNIPQRDTPLDDDYSKISIEPGVAKSADRDDFRSEVLQVRYDPCSGLLGKLTLLDRHI